MYIFILYRPLCQDLEGSGFVIHHGTKWSSFSANHYTVIMPFDKR